MDQSKSPSSWDLLADQIGAQPSADANERRRPAVEHQLPAPAVRHELPPAKAGDWDALAGELGVALPAPPPAPARERPAERAARPLTEDRDLPPARPAIPAFEGLDETEEEADDLAADELIEDELIEDDEFEDSLEEDAEDASELSGEAARSAFDALFEAGSFATLGNAFELEETEEVRQGAFVDLGDEFEDDVLPPLDEESLGPVDAEGEEQAEEEERPRRRRRRRGGRGRGRRGREEATDPELETDADPLAQDVEFEKAEAGEDGEAEEAEETDEAEGPKRRRRRRGRRRRRDEGAEAEEARGAGDDLDDQDDEDDLAGPARSRHDEDEDEEQGPVRSMSHKNIPTWSEAIGVLVDVNMSARKANPGRGDSGAPRGRGRGRGGRRRKS